MLSFFWLKNDLNELFYFFLKYRLHYSEIAKDLS